MSRNTNLFTYEKGSPRTVVESIPREFSVPVQFVSTTVVKVVAENYEEAELAATRYGRGEWPPQKEWDTIGDTEPCGDQDYANELNPNEFLRIRGAR